MTTHSTAGGQQILQHASMLITAEAVIIGAEMEFRLSDEEIFGDLRAKLKAKISV